MAHPPVLPFSSPLSQRHDAADDDDESDDLDVSFSSDTSNAPLLPTSDDAPSAHSFTDEKRAFSNPKRERRARLHEGDEEERRDGRRRTIKAAVMVVLTVLLSAGLYMGSSYVPRRAPVVEPVAVLAQAATAPLLLTHPSNRSFIDYRPKDWHPLFPDQSLDYDRDLFVENLRRSVRTNTRSSIIFHCRHTDLSLCASAYRVLFIGPTIASPLYLESTALDERRVEVEFELGEPGEYEVYAWPEHETCDQWNHGEGRPYHKLAVMGTPASLEVIGEAPVDSPSPCSADHDLTAGRWISKAFLNPAHHSPTSPYYAWLESHYLHRPVHGLTDYSSYGYIWAPYACKPRHHSFDEWLELVRPERLVVFGDSVMRDLFCQMYNYGDEVCTYQQFGDYEQSDKYIPHRLSDGTTAHLHFHWEPLGDPASLSAFLAALDTPASHIFFNVALWLTRKNPDPAVYVQRMRSMLDTLVEVAPGAKIVARTSAGAVQPIACYDLWRIQRRILEPVNAALLELLQDYPTITPLDVYPIYNARPEASQDGRHWQRLPGADENERPEEGAVGHALTDVLFEGWRLQK
ncbi:hypothetical protein JCM10207_005835 [Rhodosporidiobolus poonsookiae]